jgi:membrane-bound lytic murein transglycosylase B
MRVWIGFFTTLVALTAAAGEPVSYRSAAERFASDMERRHGLEKGEIATLMGQASYSQAVIDAIRRPYEAKPWYKYRPIFVTDKRIRGGVDFWHENQALLERAQAIYGAPPQIVTAIIGVETNYGASMGKHRVLDALSTLGFSYPSRADFFRKELEEFLLLIRDESVDALAMTGSYAGAVGLPQFIPSSYRAYAVDFDGDGRRDLWKSTADAIGSVGNYLKHHGWKTGEPIAFEARVAGDTPGGIEATGKEPARPSTSVGRLRAMEITPSESLPGSTRVTLIRLEGPEPEYWLGLDNFYVITRYNHSNLYAMAVFQLSRDIQAVYEAKDRAQAAGDKFERFGE